MTDEMRDAIRRAARAIQRQFARKPLLPKELASAVVFFDTIALDGRGDLLAQLRASPNPEALVLDVIRD